MDGTVHSSKPFMSLMYSTCACMYVTDIKQVSRQICVIYVSRQPAYLIPPADVFGHVQLIDGFWRVDDLWRHEHQQRHGGRQQAQHFLWCQNSKLQVSTSNTQDSRLFFASAVMKSLNHAQTTWSFIYVAITSDEYYKTYSRCILVLYVTM